MKTEISRPKVDDESGTIQVDIVDFDFEDVICRHQRLIVETKERRVREGLEALGWRSPEVVAVEDGMHDFTDKENERLRLALHEIKEANLPALYLKEMAAKALAE